MGPKYNKMTLSRCKNDVKNSVATIIVILRIYVQNFMRKSSK